eukprot:RCo031414
MAEADADARRLTAHVRHMYGMDGFVRPRAGPYVNESFWGFNYNLNPKLPPPRASDPEATLPLERGKRTFTPKDNLSLSQEGLGSAASFAPSPAGLHPRSSPSPQRGAPSPHAAVSSWTCSGSPSFSASPGER